MNTASPDRMVDDDNWSDLSRYRELPAIDFDAMHAYRLDRIRSALGEAGAAMCVLVSPVSLRYAVDYKTYALFQSHVPTSYLFVPVEGPLIIHHVYGASPLVDDVRAGRPISFFDGGSEMIEGARLLADDIVNYLSEIGTDNRRIAVEYVNPSITMAMMQRGLDIIDGVAIAERARLIKSNDEIECMRWAIAVAEFGIARIRDAIKPGVTELQLFGLLSYVNLANNGEWHDGRMLASGPRINPWCQEATQRQIETGDLIGVDTDMVGPFSYFADVSRTFHCGPGKPTARQKALYRLAVAEVEHNLKLVQPGMTLREIQKQAYRQAEEFHAHAYPCVIHGVGMTDEYPRVDPIFRGPNPYDDTLEAGMVLAIESFVGAVGESDGVKIEQQVLVTDDGYEMLASYPLEDSLLD